MNLSRQTMGYSTTYYHDPGGGGGGIRQQSFHNSPLNLENHRSSPLNLTSVSSLHQQPRHPAGGIQQFYYSNGDQDQLGSSSGGQQQVQSLQWDLLIFLFENNLIVSRTR